MEGIKNFFTTIWDYWLKIGRFIGNIIGRIFLTAFYVTIALPFGVGVSLFNDPLDIRDKTKPATWTARTSPEATIEASYELT